MTKMSTEDCWGAIYSIGSEDGEADKIPPEVVAKLIELKLVTVNATGLPELTAYGQQAFTTMESGDGEIPELEAEWC